MRYTEFWARLDEALGAEAQSWAQLVVLPELGSRTVTESLEAGVPPKRVWAVVWETLNLPESAR